MKSHPLFVCITQRLACGEQFTWFFLPISLRWASKVKCLTHLTRYNSRKYHYLPWPLQWRHNDYDGVSDHQSHDCLLYRLFRRRTKKISKLRVTGLCVGNSSVTGEFPAQRTSNAENVSIWWRHHGGDATEQWLTRQPTVSRPPKVYSRYGFRWQRDHLYVVLR